MARPAIPGRTKDGSETTGDGDTRPDHAAAATTRFGFDSVRRRAGVSADYLLYFRECRTGERRRNSFANTLNCSYLIAVFSIVRRCLKSDTNKVSRTDVDLFWQNRTDCD